MKRVPTRADGEPSQGRFAQPTTPMDDTTVMRSGTPLPPAEVWEYDAEAGMAAVAVRAGGERWDARLWVVRVVEPADADGILRWARNSLEADQDAAAFRLAAEVFLAGGPREDAHWAFHAPDADAAGVVLRREIALTLLRRSTATVTRLIPGLDVETAGGACPFQAEGTWNGHPFYFRYRGGFAALRVGGQDVIIDPRWVASMDYGDPMAGFLDMAEFTYLMCVLAEQIAAQPDAPGVVLGLPPEPPREA